MTSANDKAVLNAIFNPVFGDIDDEQIVSSENGQPVSEECDELTSDEEKRAKQLEIEAVQAAERGQLDDAIKLFDEAISLAPTRATCYNNRAQALRLKGDVSSALNDLNRAVELSAGRCSAGSNALCQRALLHRLEGREQEALADFERAAKSGHSFAKAQLVKLNPYAALCNQMLGEMIATLQTPCSVEENK